MRGLLLFLPVILMAQAPPPKPPEASASMTDDEKTIYALALSVSRSLPQFDLSPAEIELVRRALADAAAGKPAVDLNTWGPKIQPLAQARASKGSDRGKEAFSAYLAKPTADPRAVKTDSGLIYREVKAGAGEPPK